jgi:hypothetical protein
MKENNSKENVLEKEIDEIADKMAMLLFGFEQNMKEEEVQNGLDSVVELNNHLADIVANRDLNVLETLYASMYSSVLLMKMFTGNIETEEAKEARKEVEEYLKGMQQ